MDKIDKNNNKKHAYENEEYKEERNKLKEYSEEDEDSKENKEEEFEKYDDEDEEDEEIEEEFSLEDYTKEFDKLLEDVDKNFLGVKDMKYYYNIAFSLPYMDSTTSVIQNDNDEDMSKKELFLHIIDKEPKKYPYVYLALKNYLQEYDIETIKLNDGRELDVKGLVLEAIDCDKYISLPYGALAFLVDEKEKITLKDGRELNQNELNLKAIHYDKNYAKLIMKEKLLSTINTTYEELVYSLVENPDDFLALCYLRLMTDEKIYIPSSLDEDISKLSEEELEKKKNTTPEDLLKRAIKLDTDKEYVYAGLSYFIAALTLAEEMKFDGKNHSELLQEAVKLNSYCLDYYLFAGLYLNESENISFKPTPSPLLPYKAQYIQEQGLDKFILMKKVKKNPRDEFSLAQLLLFLNKNETFGNKKAVDIRKNLEDNSRDVDVLYILSKDTQYLSKRVDNKPTIRIEGNYNGLTQKDLLNKVLKFDSSNAHAYVALGCSLLNGESTDILGENLSQQEIFIKAISLDESCAKAYLSLAFTIDSLDENEEVVMIDVNGTEMGKADLYGAYSSF